MKIIYPYIIFIFLCISSLQAQDNNLIIGLEGKYHLPIGSLSNRFNGGVGGTFYIGTQVSEKWTWAGKLEYYRLDDENRDKLFKKVEAEVDGKLTVFNIPLENLSLDLTVIGLSAEAKYNILRTDMFETDLNIGFGFFYWESERSEYKDEVSIKDAQDQDVTIANIDVPNLFQKDWSGALNLGLDFNVKLIEPVWFNANVNYRLLITELWPTLALDLENVSGLQFINVGSGVRIKL